MSNPTLDGIINQNSSVNKQKSLKYKTVLCKHFDTPQGCSYGQKCQFAHGHNELRKKDAQLAPLIKNQNNILNYKIVKCKNWEKDQACKYGSLCTFAHGNSEIRNRNDNLFQLGPFPIMMPYNFDMNSMGMMIPPNFNLNQMQQISTGKIEKNKFMTGMVISYNNENIQSNQVQNSGNNNWIIDNLHILVLNFIKFIINTRILI